MVVMELSFMACVDAGIFALVLVDCEEGKMGLRQPALDHDERKQGEHQTEQIVLMESLYACNYTCGGIWLQKSPRWLA